MVVTRNQRKDWKSFNYGEEAGAPEVPSPRGSAPSHSEDGVRSATRRPGDTGTQSPARSPPGSDREVGSSQGLQGESSSLKAGSEGVAGMTLENDVMDEPTGSHKDRNGKEGGECEGSASGSALVKEEETAKDDVVKEEVAVKDDAVKEEPADESDAAVKIENAGAVGTDPPSRCATQTRSPWTVNTGYPVANAVKVETEAVENGQVKEEPCMPNGAAGALPPNQKSVHDAPSPWTVATAPAPSPTPPSPAKEKKKDCTTMHVCSVPIEFPHATPYAAQRQVMVKVVQACQKEQCALLESPTGTGKTLALLCSALAWQQTYISKVKKNQKAAPSYAKYTAKVEVKYEDSLDISKLPCEDGGNESSEEPAVHVPKIFYATRTHTQVKQVVRELKKTKYTPKMTVLGSRDQYCIHPDISQLKRTEKQDECMKAIKKKSMNKYVCHMAEEAKKLKADKNHIFDIEELVEFGKSKGFCPYFASKEWLKDAELVLCPYNYILDPDIMKNMEISLDNNIVIFDEAHNLEDIARESCKISMTMRELTILKNDLRRTGRPDYEQLNRITLDTITAVLTKDTQDHNEQRLKNLYASPPIYRGFLFEEFLKRIGWTIQHLEVIGEVVTSIEKIESAEIGRLGHGNLSSAESTKCLAQLGRAAKFLRDQSNRLCYMGMTIDNNGDPVLKLDCLWPGVASHHLKRSRALILSSGTLHPMDSFSGELGLDFPIQLQANHAVDTKKQVTTMSPMYGCNGGEIIGTMKNRDSAYYQTIGASLLKLAEISPHGMLVFMASYELLRKMKEEWMGSGIWHDFFKHKNVLEEPRDAEEMKEVMKTYSRQVHRHTRGEGRPPMLLSVCRGRVSEGFDFKDNMCRLVVTVGIPYPNFGDPVIQSKRIFNDKYKEKYNLLTGNQWYSQCAFRSLNQSLGRVLRHAHDYGALVLLDGRFYDGSMDTKLSKWVQSTIQRTDSLDESVRMLVPFYEKNSDLQKLADEHAEEEPIEFDDCDEDYPSGSRRLPEVYAHGSVNKRHSNPFFRYTGSHAGPPKKKKGNSL